MLNQAVVARFEIEPYWMHPIPNSDAIGADGAGKLPIEEVRRSLNVVVLQRNSLSPNHCIGAFLRNEQFGWSSRAGRLIDGAGNYFDTEARCRMQEAVTHGEGNDALAWRFFRCHPEEAIGASPRNGNMPVRDYFGIR